MNQCEMKEKKIGKGAYGEVYTGKDLRTNEMFAVKKIRMDAEGIDGTTMREISLLKAMHRPKHHPNIVRPREIVVNTKDKCVYLVLELLDHDLKKHMNVFPADFKNHRVVKRFLYQILQGVAYCHSREVLHRDLKPQNVLIDCHNNNTVKLADFGLARMFRRNTVQKFTHEVVTLWYRAPEILLGAEHYSTPVGVWSVGCIFAEMVNQKILFPGDNENDQLFRIFRILGTPTEETWPDGASLLHHNNKPSQRWSPVDLKTVVPTTLEPAGIDLLSKMLQLDPSKRIDARTALEHEYFRGLEHAN